MDDRIINLLNEDYITKRVNPEKLIKEIYVNYYNSVLFIGRMNYECSNYYLYAFKCPLDKECIVEVGNYIGSKEPIEPFFFVSHIENNVLNKLVENGYCKLPNIQRYNDYLYDDICRNIKNLKNRCTILNSNNILEISLKEWVGIKPMETSNNISERHHNETITNTLQFIKEWEFLLLSDDEVLRNLYKEYRQKDTSFYNRCMSYDR